MIRKPGKRPGARALGRHLLHLHDQVQSTGAMDWREQAADRSAGTSSTSQHRDDGLAFASQFEGTW